MTREEAIDILNQEKKHCEVHLNDSGKSDEYYKEMNELVETYDMAIKALLWHSGHKPDECYVDIANDKREPVADILKKEIAKVSYELNRIVNELHALNKKK